MPKNALLGKKTIARSKFDAGLFVENFAKWPRLQQMARLAALGCSDKAIAGRLSISINTVKVRFSQYRKALRIPSRTYWVPFAIRQRIVTLDEPVPDKV